MGPKEYINSLFVSEDDVLASIEKGLIERGMPKISVPPEVGKTIYLLAKMVGAKRILEIGALGGYSTIWLARALPEDGQVVSLELSSAHAAFAQENVQRAGVGDRVTFCVGDAQESLKRLELQGETFDFFFIDADKENYPTYLESAFRLAHPGAIIAADNTLQKGRVFNPDDERPSTKAIRTFNRALATDPRLEAMLLAIGDGLAVARIK